MLIFKFTDGRVEEGQVSVPSKGTPCLYFLSEKGKESPFYIGEYGKSKTYTIVGRIAHHFKAYGTLNRVARNMPSFKNKVPRKVVAHIFVLDRKFMEPTKRKSLEAWVIYMACHIQKIQDKRFAVTKYNAPSQNHDYSSHAARVLASYKKALLTTASSRTP